MKQKTDQWGTPPSIYRYLGAFGAESETWWYDPCPHPKQECIRTAVSGDSRKVIIYTSPVGSPGRRDGLAGSWGVRNFVNPPFSNPVPWINKAFGELLGGRVTVMCLPAFTDRRWWLDGVEPHLNTPHRQRLRAYFIGRHKYVPLDGQHASNPRFGTVLLTFGFSARRVWLHRF